MRLRHYWGRLRTLSAGELVRRARDRGEAGINRVLRRWNGYRKPTYLTRSPAWLSPGLSRIFPAAVPAPSGFDPGILSDGKLLCGHLLAHRFDFLGSGWVAGDFPAGIAAPVNPANRTESERIRSLVRKDYKPIDWHSDFKSRHRWPSDLWHADQDYGSTPGADIKIPWELARMQNLAQLAWAHGIARDKSEADSCRAEFRDQILDFIAGNPPGFGVNWVCPMDIGIRIANWILVRDLFLASGAEFDPAFESVFARSVLEHGRHILRNLEWYPGLRGNHYFANIAGLAIAACALPSAPEPDAWLAFAMRELIRETEIQFLPDGGNFEASTVYHRLSAEMACYATAAILALPPARLAAAAADGRKHARYLPRFFRSGPLPRHAYPGWEPIPFPPWFFERLERAAEFAMHITRPDGKVPQLGDNDSGRFLKLFPTLASGGEGREDFLDFRHLVAALNGFFGRADFAAFAGVAGIEADVVSALLAERKFPSYRPDRPGVQAADAVHGKPARYPDFGLYIIRKPAVWLAFRCGPIGQLGNGGHAHNDQLSFELSVGGASFLEDPGTHIYTPDWASRNRFRSTAYHNTLSISGLEQNPWENSRSGLFALISRSRAELLEVGDSRISGRHSGFGSPHERILELGEDRLTGTDICPQPGAKTLAFHFAPEVRVALSADGATVEARRDGLLMRLSSESGSWSVAAASSSPGYGVLRPAQAAHLDLSGDSRAKWYIDWCL